MCGWSDEMNDELTLDLSEFWPWLMIHPNCILRAGTPETVIYDDEDLHWGFGMEDGDTMVVQVLRGKRPVGEILVAPDQVSHVRAFDGDIEGEYVFELISDSTTGPFASFFFVLAHGLDSEEQGAEVH